MGAGYQFALSGDQFALADTAFAIAPATDFTSPLRPLVNSGFELKAGLSLWTKGGIELDLTYSGLWAENGQDVQEVSAAISIPF